AGVVDPGEAETLAGILFQAVREGTREGVSAAETFQNVERYLQGLLAQGVTANERSLAFYAALLDRLSETQDRALMGEVGARAVGNILEGLTRTGQPGLEVLAFRALGDSTAWPQVKRMLAEEGFEEVVACEGVAPGPQDLRNLDALSPARGLELG
ncbi:hypothetical protein CSW23_08415, partial [Thermus scotoductus]